MAFDIERRRFLRIINSKYIYDTVPLLHLLVLLLELAMIGRITAKFNSYYAARPVLTMMVTNAVLGGIADTVAQTITSIRLRAVRKPGGVNEDDTVAIEIHELDKQNPLNEQTLISDSQQLPPPFDFERLARFAGYGFFMAPIQLKWFQFLSWRFPVTKASAFGPALKRVACDQLIFAPAGIAVFFTTMTIAEGGGRRAIVHKIRDMYLPTLKANYIVWPTVQIINFRLMPIQLQVLKMYWAMMTTILLFLNRTAFVYDCAVASAGFVLCVLLFSVSVGLILRASEQRDHGV